MFSAQSVFTGHFPRGVAESSGEFPVSGPGDKIFFFFLPKSENCCATKSKLELKWSDKIKK